MNFITKMLSTEELRVQMIDLSKQTTDMLSKSCAITFLKELCDALNYDISYRINQGYLWCFFRANVFSRIMFVTRLPCGPIDVKRLVSHLMIQKIQQDSWPLHKEYEPRNYNYSLILLLKEYSREFAKRTPLHPTQAVQELALKKGYKVKWEFEINQDRWVCTCVASKSKKITIRGKSSVVPFGDDAKKEAKRLASVFIFNTLLSK